MNQQTDPEFLRSEAYDQAGGLETRLEIQRRYRTQNKPWFRWVFEHLELPIGERTLELGCGTGDLWLENLERLPEGLNLTLSDLSEGMLAGLPDELSRPGFDCLALDAQSIGFPAASFAAVIGLGLLDHLPSRRAALGEIRRVLRPGGNFYTSAGGEAHLREMRALVQPYLPWDRPAPVGGESERFGLDNGAELLAPWFEQVRLYRYDDTLSFTDPEPVLAYILSEAGLDRALGGKRRQAFERRVRQVMDEQGILRVQVQKGVFAAR